MDDDERLLWNDRMLYGFSVVDEHGKRVDPRSIAPAATQFPSFMTLREFRQTMIFIERQAVEAAWDELSYNPIVSILVRDGGSDSIMPAPWIEFSIGDTKYAIWRRTMDLYRVGPDGAVEDDPIISNDRSDDDAE